jgi:hypothetical protein
MQSKDPEPPDLSTSYVCKPPPPVDLWDTDDSDYLERVKCHAVVRVTGIDPKNGTFTIRMKCHWSFRTLNSQEEAEVRWRGVPGIRMIGVVVSVEESRIWKDLSRASYTKTPPKTVFWKGTSVFTIGGFKPYHMENFPFDRQILDLERLDFVWRPDKDDADYYKMMKIASFTMNVNSVLPEWETFPAYIMVQEKPKVEESNATIKSEAPDFASRFNVQMRIQRRHMFYIRQVFFISYLITIVSIVPLAMPATEDHMGDRLSLFGGGLLTLVAFKYGIADHLPCVPYATFTDDFLIYQILTIALLCIETVFSWRWNLEIQEQWDAAEIIAFWLLVMMWTMYLLFCWLWKPKHRNPWTKVLELAKKLDQFELDDVDHIHSLGVQEAPAQY